MQALILAGGKGTRLRPLTVYTPKPIVPVMNRPFLLYQIDILREAGVTDITLSLSYQPDKIEQVLGDGSDHGVRLRYTTEPSPMGTGGAYKFALDALRDTTIVLNGDILSNVSIKDLVDGHRAKNADATIAVVGVDDVSCYGLVEMAADNRIVRFVEKPEGPDQPCRTINAGIYVLEPAILDLIAADTSRSFEYEVFPDILAKRLEFFGFDIGESYWRDIGTPANYLEAHHDLLAGKASFPPQEPPVDRSEVATRSDVDKASVLADGCSIKSGARVRNSVIGAGVYLDEKAVVEDSVIWSHTRVSSAAEIRGAVIGRSCHIGRNAVVSPGTVLGDKTTLTDYTKV